MQSTLALDRMSPTEESREEQRESRGREREEGEEEREEKDIDTQQNITGTK